MSKFVELTYDRPFRHSRNQQLLELMETRFLIKAAISNCDADKYYWRAQAEALYKKNLSLDSDAEMRESKAYKKWLDAEEQCAQTNARFDTLVSGGFPERGALIFSVSRKIAKILGPAPSLSDLPFGFGPGASVGCSKNTNARSKLAARVTVSANAAHLVSWVAGSHPFWPLESYTVEKGKLTFVPKTAEIDRSIVIEPILNTYLQKGAGEWIRRRLKRAGCDLDSQETNRNLARFASVTGALCTVDLSSASDTLAKAVVEAVLPYDWYSLLCQMRTASVTYGSTLHTLQKFSSMGNGFTFELESLIFFAIAKSVCEDTQFVSVYGDDIVVPTRCYDALCDALHFFGFSVNREKSFASGPFRESCGKDYYLGVDVRPVYVKECLSVRQLFRLHNFFKRKHDEETAAMVFGFIPSGFRRFTGPDGFGDGHLIGDFVPIRFGRSRGWALKGFRSFSATPIVRRRSSGAYPALLYLHSRGAGSDRQITEGALYQERGTSEWRAKAVYFLG